HLVDDCQTVLVATSAGPAIEEFGRCVQRRKAGDHRDAGLVQIFDQTEIGDFYVTSLKQQVAGLDVQVLQPVLLEHVIQRISRVLQVREQLVARDALAPLLPELLEAVFETSFGQLGDDNQSVTFGLNSLDIQQERMSQLAHQLQ